MTDPYITFASGAQALRRRCEALTWGMGGALGVAADPYPHQLRTIRRVLTDIRVRHLIADEVGLGKTIQALMIMNALRFQNPDHKTVILAPERLIGQWQAEAWTRGHVRAAVVGTEEAERVEAPPVLLVRPRDVQDDVSVLDPDSRELLIVDEPQSIPLDVMRRVAALCSGTAIADRARFRQVLILSATPRLSDPRWRSIILEMLEPERSGIASLSSVPSLEFLEKLEAQALAGLGGIAEGEPSREGELLFRMKAVTRRISRQTRKEWGSYLPERRNETIRFEPTASEAHRLEVIQGVLRRNTGRTDLASYPWPNIRAMLRSRRSARAALDALSENSGRADIAQARVKSLEDPGDARFEALLDVLSSQWSTKPEERFIIVAGDAPTIDMLSVALPRYFPELGEDGAIASLRRPPGATEETATDIRQMYEAVTPFVSGSARLLLLGDWVQAGLNLHHASRNIIFYSLPWDPQAVDQLIGRIDRLRRGGFRRAHGGEHFGHVRIWRLVMRHSPEEAVSDVMDAIGVFERPLPQISEEEAADIELRIERSARGLASRCDLDTLAETAAAWDARGLLSRLERFDPVRMDRSFMTPEAASAPARIEPAMGTPRPAESVVEQCEAANKSWIRMLEGSGTFQIGVRPDRDASGTRFHTLWYPHGQPGYPFPVTELGTDGFQDGHATFLIERRRLASPPRSTVITDEGEIGGRLLRFFDHGESIHDDLVRGFIRISESQFRQGLANQVHCVRLGAGHPLLEFATKTLLLSAGYGEPARALNASDIPERLKRLVGEASTDAQRERFVADVREFMEDLRADQRWLQEILPPALELRASTLGDNSWSSVEPCKVPLLFKPLSNDGEFRPTPRTVPQAASPIPPVLARAALAAHEAVIGRSLRDSTGNAQKKAVRAIEGRLTLITAEGQDMVELRRMQLESRSSDEVGGAQRDMLRGLLQGLEKRLAIAVAMPEERRKRLLDGTLKSVERLPEHVWHLFVRFVPIPA